MPTKFTAGAIGAGALSATILCGCGAPSRVAASSLRDEVHPVGEDQALSLTVTARARVLPDAPELRPTFFAWCLTGPTCLAGARPIFDLATATALSTGRTVSAPLAATSTYAVQLSYRNGFGGMESAVSLPSPWAGTVGNGPIGLSVAMRRIDVRPMSIARPDGTGYTASGAARISMIAADSSETLLGTIATGSGLDVLPGFRYRVYVTARGEDGPKSDTAVLDFTH